MHSWLIIDNLKNTLSTYDSGVKISGSHRKPHRAFQKKKASKAERGNGGVWSKYRYHDKTKERAADTGC